MNNDQHSQLPTVNSQLKDGYKQTEVGVIPADWGIQSLGFICDVRDGTHESPRFFKHGVPFITSKNIVDGHLDLENVSYISVDDAIDFDRRSKVDRLDILMSMIGTIGSAVLVDCEPSFCIKNVALIKPKKAVPDFLIQLINSANFQRYLAGNLDGGIQKFISLGTLRQLSIPLPSEAEQRAIATALTDVDALLDAQDKLIAKKRDIKQAAMQQLLTGKQRLPGFSGEWEVKCLSEIGDISSAGVDKKMRAGETPVRLVNYLDVYRKDFIYSDDLNHWVTAPQHQLKRCAVKEGDIFFTPSSETRDDIGKSAVAMEDIPDATYSYHVTRLRLRDDWNLRFRTYAFKTRAFLDQAEMLCDGSGTRYVISQGKFKSMTVQVPPVEEQTAIATVLSDMDFDLAALEQQRDKTRALKQGMMQELLTGRIRLV
ncbi:hypothetical protein COW64_18705 [bacterium (Candidatus Blackallbacteria) CG18_big_fil_WC_8_21_14_2_50_49_26]|nr:MAG: hypothetical protein COW64_18705 [bacterium (Candidatus Blackallbacteria) CG18_big_fil_WC_8_21_14_2_50_49_26]